ncbi:MAG: ribosomal protein S18-alanine N-acetyltransferase [Pseudomonadota bacterium]
MAEPTREKLELRLLRMRDRDLREVLLVERSAYSYPWSERVFQDCLRVGYSCWLARACGEDGRALRGFAVMSIGAGEAHVLNLCVDAEWHRRGVGQRLLTHLRLVARNHQVARMLLEVRPSNGGAIALYEGAGFTRIGERKGYYPSADGREDAIVMALDIDELSTGRSSVR